MQECGVGAAVEYVGHGSIHGQLLLLHGIIIATCPAILYSTSFPLILANSAKFWTLSTAIENGYLYVYGKKP
jgi:hypothetical protein